MFGEATVQRRGSGMRLAESAAQRLGESSALRQRTSQRQQQSSTQLDRWDAFMTADRETEQRSGTDGIGAVLRCAACRLAEGLRLDGPAQSRRGK